MSSNPHHDEAMMRFSVWVTAADALLAQAQEHLGPVANSQPALKPYMQRVATARAQLDFGIQARKAVRHG